MLKYKKCWRWDLNPRVPTSQRLLYNFGKSLKQWSKNVLILNLLHLWREINQIADMINLYSDFPMRSPSSDSLWDTDYPSLSLFFIHVTASPLLEYVFKEIIIINS